jgi:hypothetical protein
VTLRYPAVIGALAGLLWGFASELQHVGARPRVETKAQCIQLVQNGSDSSQVSSRLCFQEHAQRASECKIQEAGMAPGEGVIDQQQRAGSLNGKRERLPLARTKVRGKGQPTQLVHSRQTYPWISSRVREGYPTRASFGELADYGFWDRNLAVEGRQEVQQSSLEEILEGRGIRYDFADTFRHSQDPL